MYYMTMLKNEMLKMKMPQLKKLINKNLRLSELLDRELHRLYDVMEEKRMTNYGIKKGEIVVGRAIVFNKMRNIIGEVYHIGENWLNKMEISIYTAGYKKYQFPINKIRKAKKNEILKFQTAKGKR